MTIDPAEDETGALTVQHTEYIKDIYGIEFSGDPLVPTTNMSSDIVVINPGKAESFPWLSQIAANYEEYEIKQLMYCYKSKVSDNLTSSDGQVGSIIMFTEYNANDAMKKTKQQLLQAYGTTNALINTSDVLHGVECDISKLKGDGHKYVRTENLSTSIDKSDYDWAKLQVAVVDTPAQLSNQVVGELYVSYTVVLRKPRLFSTLALNLQEDQFLINKPQGLPSAVTTVTAASELNSIGCVLTATLAGTATVTIASGSTVSMADNSTDFAGQVFKLTFPASFSGDVELIAKTDGMSQQFTTANPTTGNIELISNIPVTSNPSDPSAIAISANASGGGQSDFANAQGSKLLHLRVSQASFGVDNTISFTLLSGNNGGQLWVKCQRYNGHEIDTAPVFKQLTSAGKVDPQDITVAIIN